MHGQARSGKAAFAIFALVGVRVATSAGVAGGAHVCLAWWAVPAALRHHLHGGVDAAHVSSWTRTPGMQSHPRGVVDAYVQQIKGRLSSLHHLVRLQVKHLEYAGRVLVVAHQTGDGCTRIELLVAAAGIWHMAVDFTSHGLRWDTSGLAPEKSRMASPLYECSRFLT
eukprot:352425-Chlamydomonas_euryale.AAC.2